MTKRSLIGVTLLALAACGGNAGDTIDEATVSEVTTAETVEEETTVAEGETIEVTAHDYVFNGLPESVVPGASFTLRNDSEAEAHEMVVVRIADEETRNLEELLELPEEDTEDVVEFQGVLVALPGEEGVNPEAGGDSITVTEPGRYAVVCFIPEGADLEVVEQALSGAAEAEEEPDLGDGTPHAFLGMVGEFQVED